MGDALPAVDLGSGRRVVDVSVGNWHVCAVLDDGSVKCWGRNDKGQLGLGDTGDRGDGSGEMGDALPAVDLGSNRTAVHVSPNRGHSCAVLDDGSVKCWGGNDVGQLGLGDTENRGDGLGEMGDALPSLDVGLVERCGWEENAACNNTVGSYTCVCEVGYERVESGSCGDVDECGTGAHNCDVGAAARWRASSWRACEAGCSSTLWHCWWGCFEEADSVVVDVWCLWGSW